MNNQIFDKVVEYLTNQFPISKEDITEDTILKTDLGADSADLMMLVMDLEMEYEITVEDEALQTIKTVGDIVRYIEANT